MTGACPDGAVTPDAANAFANSSARSTNAYGSTWVKPMSATRAMAPWRSAETASLTV